MTADEVPVLFDCRGESLVGICHRPDDPPQGIGVVIVVGGPQYRVGSHRQFVLLARHLAELGIPVFRFDYRGMGDSSGSTIGFEQINPDIEAAISTFIEQIPQLEQIVLWGLCDAASAIMMYALENDSRVVGQILLNPWVRTEEGMARVYLKSYYTRRIMNRAFWRKVVQGKLKVGEALSGLVSSIQGAFHRSPEDQQEGDSGQEHYTERMRHGMEEFTGQSLFILSGNDLTADEFRQFIAGSFRWKALLDSDRVEITTLPSANHTFSRADWRNQVADWCAQWLRDFRQ